MICEKHKKEMRLEAIPHGRGKTDWICEECKKETDELVRKTFPVLSIAQMMELTNSGGD